MCKGGYTGWRKFFADNARIAFFGTIAFIATTYIVRPGELANAYESLLKGTQLQARQLIIDDFIRSSHKHIFLTNKIIHSKATNAQRFEWDNDSFSDYTIDLNRLVIYFGKEFETPRKIIIDARRCIRNVFLDMRPTTKPDMNLLIEANMQLRGMNSALSNNALFEIGLSEEKKEIKPMEKVGEKCCSDYDDWP